MKNQKVLKNLEKLFWVIGWVVLAITFIGVAATVYRHYSPPEVFGQQVEFPSDSFALFIYLKQLFSGFGEAFFAFLMSSVFTMTIHRQPVDLERAERFLLCTCVGWIGAGVISMISWGRTIYMMSPGSSLILDNEWWQVGVTVLTWLGSLQSLMPFIYALTVYVLFQQFSRMIIFEAETA